jgi:hypothetical protein
VVVPCLAFNSISRGLIEEEEEEEEEVVVVICM